MMGKENVASIQNGLLGLIKEGNFDTRYSMDEPITEGIMVSEICYSPKDKSCRIPQEIPRRFRSIETNRVARGGGVSD